MDESGTCGDVLDAIQDVLCLGRVRVLSPIKIYGSKEEIRAQKSPETVDAPGFAPDASIPVILYGAAGEIRTLGRLLTYTRFPVVLVMTASILLHIVTLDSKNHYTRIRAEVKQKI